MYNTEQTTLLVITGHAEVNRFNGCGWLLICHALVYRVGSRLAMPPHPCRMYFWSKLQIKKFEGVERKQRHVHDGDSIVHTLWWRLLSKLGLEPHRLGASQDCSHGYTLEDSIDPQDYIHVGSCIHRQCQLCSSWLAHCNIVLSFRCHPVLVSFPDHCTERVQWSGNETNPVYASLFKFSGRLPSGDTVPKPMEGKRQHGYLPSGSWPWRSGRLPTFMPNLRIFASLSSALKWGDERFLNP